MIINIITLLGEYLVRSERTENSLFEAFCEHNILQEFFYLTSQINHPEINLQIVKTFAFIVPNIKNQMTLYYLFSNNIVNNIISNSDFSKYDEDFLSYYVNFLKSLTLKINESTCEFFFHANINSFPLIESALKLYNHPDGMIKNVVRNIFLTILKFNFPQFDEYITSLPSVTYFAYVACRFKDMLISLNNEKQYERFHSLIEDITEDVIYIQDIFSLNNENINYILSNCMMYYCVLPVIINSISGSKPIIPINLAIFMLVILFHFIKNENFLNVLYSLVFLPLKSERIVLLTQHSPNDAKGYYYDWNKQNKQTINSFQEYVSLNYSAKFLLGLRYQKQSKYNELNDIINKFEQLEQNEKDFNPKSENYLTIVSRDVLGFFSTSETAIMAEDHKQLSKATGVNIGLSTHETDNCVNRKVESMLRQYFNKEDNTNCYYKETMLKNETIESLLSFLNCKDDNLILLVNLLIYITLEQTKLTNAISIDIQKESHFISCNMLNKDNDISRNNKHELKQEQNSNMIQLEDNSNSNSEQNNTQQMKISISDFVKKSKINNTHYIQSLTKEYIESKEFIGKYSNTSSPYSYNKTYIDALLKLFSPQTPFRAITHYLMVHNIRTLTFITSNDNDPLKTECILSMEHKDQLRSIYFNYLTTIQDIINKHTLIKTLSYSLFEKVYNSFIHPPKITQLLSENSFILPFDITGNVDDDPSHLRLITNENTIECFEVNLYVFMLLHDLVKESEKCNSNELLRNYFPLGSTDFALNQQIESLELGQDTQQFKCGFKLSSNRHKEFEESLVVIHNNKLYVGDVPQQPNTVMFKMKYLLNEMEVAISTHDNKIVKVVVKRQTSQTVEVVEFELLFETHKLATNIKERLINDINNAKVLANIYLDSYLEELFSEFIS